VLDIKIFFAVTICEGSGAADAATVCANKAGTVTNNIANPRHTIVKLTFIMIPTFLYFP
jgi:hypothetical protein